MDDQEKREWVLGIMDRAVDRWSDKEMSDEELINAMGELESTLKRAMVEAVAGLVPPNAITVTIIMALTALLDSAIGALKTSGNVNKDQIINLVNEIADHIIAIN